MYKNILRAQVTDEKDQVAQKDNPSFSVWALRLRSPEEREYMS